MTASSPTAGGREAFESIYGPPPGKLMETTHGTTHYLLETSSGAPSGGPLVVLIHGIAGQLGLFDQIAADLLAQGVASQILRYDFYDRGYSESNKTKYPIHTTGVHPLEFTLDLYVEQLRDVLEKLELTAKKMILCGHSTGGVTAIGYAAAQTPDKNSNIAGLVLIDSVALPIQPPFISKISNLPVIGNILVSLFGVKGFMTFIRTSLAQPKEMQDFLDKMERNASTNPRFFAAVRSTNQNCKGFGGKTGTAEPEYRQCCEAKIPIQLIWGKVDKAVPYSHCCTMKAIAEELGTSVSELSFEGMPHNVFFPDAKPKECSQCICEFVSGTQK